MTGLRMPEAKRITRSFAGASRTPVQRQSGESPGDVANPRGTTVAAVHMGEPLTLNHKTLTECFVNVGAGR